MRNRLSKGNVMTGALRARQDTVAIEINVDTVKPKAAVRAFLVKCRRAIFDAIQPVAAPAKAHPKVRAVFQSISLV
ncbi:MAG: hypothetical protein JSS10_09345 [Verrucomicrobia bacterium]|nr:hypothetical protein [Verrucomicrobiota bacterium]